MTTPAARGSRWPLLAALVIHFALGMFLAATKAPWCDEGWFANPSQNLAFHGQMGTNVLEPSGHSLNAYLSGIQQRTYIVTPNQLVSLAAWYRAAGFSLFTMRLHGLLWGALVLVALYFIALTLFADARVAQVGVLLASVDFMLLWIGADGRSESMAAALALGAVACYLHWREVNFQKAIAASQVLGALALFTHPNSLLVLLAIFAIAVAFDRPKIRWRHVPLAALPYLICAGAWGLYIMQSPGDFKAQFLANAAGHGGGRMQVFLTPWLSVWNELRRHVGVYVGSSLVIPGQNPLMIFIPFFYLAANVWFLRRWRNLGGPERIFVVATATVVLGLTFLNGLKAVLYLEYVIPLYELAFAALLLHLWTRGRNSRAVSGLLAVSFAAIQLSTSYQHIRSDEYHRDYLPTIKALENERAQGKRIAGTAALGFGLGFTGFTDDWRLGLYSGHTPDVIVLDRSYRECARRFGVHEPHVMARYEEALSSQYQLAARHGSFWLLKRLPPQAPPAPLLETGGLTHKEKGQRADYLFTLLAGDEYEKPPAARSY